MAKVVKVKARFLFDSEVKRLVAACVKMLEADASSQKEVDQMHVIHRILTKAGIKIREVEFLRDE